MSIYDFLNVQKKEPSIVTLHESIKVIGVSIRTNAKLIFRDSQKLGQQYKRVKNAGLIKNKRDPWGFAAISKDFAEDGSWDYLMGDMVTDFTFIPTGLSGFEIPAKTYAVFSFQPRSILTWGIAMGLMKKYIFTEWLPKSKYSMDDSILGDFEYHDQRSVSKKPEIDLYVSIMNKES